MEAENGQTQALYLRINHLEIARSRSAAGTGENRPGSMSGPGDRRGDYSPTNDRIRLSTHDTKTFFHELAHAAHDRLNGLEGSKSEKEAIAEFTATVLMELYDLGDRSGNCWTYIRQYAKDPLKAIMKAMSTIEQVLQLLTETR